MYLNHPQTSSCPFAVLTSWRSHKWRERKVFVLFLKRASKPHHTNPAPPAASPSRSSCIAISLPPSHASLLTLPTDRQTWCTVMAVQSFSETVHKMQSRISILRDKPTMYLNVLLLLNNWEKYKVRKKKNKKKNKNATSDQQFPGQKVVHTLPNILVEAWFFFLFVCFFYCKRYYTPGPGHGLCL